MYSFIPLLPSTVLWFVSLQCWVIYYLLFSGKMSDTRAVRKQQQLNNLVAMVKELAGPHHTLVDFCSGGVSQNSFL